jgi:TolB-like protein
MLFHFGGHTLDLERRELHRGAELVALEPQVFDLLVHLVRNRGRVISKDELIQGVWGGRIVSDATIHSRVNAARQAVGDSGAAQLVIRTMPRKGVRFVAEVREEKAVPPPVSSVVEAATSAESPVILPDKPSVAVLAFKNMSGDPEQEYFADGMVEEIITALSRMRGLFVVARNSSFTYKGHAVDVKRVGRELGVRYIVEGSVRKAGGRVRITAQVIEAATGSHIYADRYEGAVDDLWGLQDQIVEEIAGIMEPTLQRAEIERVRRKPPESLEAYDHYLRALSLTDVFTPTSVHAMHDHCSRAIALDPSFAPAYALAARVYIQRKIQGWGENDANESACALDLVERGLRADRFDPMMLATAGQSFAWFAHDLIKGISYIDEALAINPNPAHAFMQSGMLRARVGQTALAIEHLQRARRLSPRDSRNYAIFQAMALAYHLHGDVETALEWARRGAQHNANYLPAWREYAAAAGVLGRQIEAQAAAARVLAIDSKFSINRLKGRYPTVPSETYERYLQGLRLAGIPE